MGQFREWLREAEKKDIKEQSEYQKFFAKKLEKFGVKSPSELSKEEKIKFFDEIDAEWKSEDENSENEVDEKKECNESKSWSDVEEVTKKVANLFKGRSKITAKNALSIEVDGVIGKITFDPSFKM